MDFWHREVNRDSQFSSNPINNAEFFSDLVIEFDDIKVPKLFPREKGKVKIEVATLAIILLMTEGVASGEWLGASEKKKDELANNWFQGPDQQTCKKK